MTEHIILYPRSYNKRGDESLHSVRGVDREGREINVKLRISEALRGYEGCPSIVEFSRNDRKAKMACSANPANGPETPDGIILFTHCVRDESDTDKESWIARWAHILTEDSDGPAPIYGVGRVSINRNTNEVINARRFMEQLLRDRPEEIEEIQRLKSEIDNPRNFHYPVILYRFEEAIRFSSDDAVSMGKAMEEIIDRLTHSGFTGGFSLREFDNDGMLIGCQEHFSKFSTGIKRYQSGQESVASFLLSYTRDKATTNFELVPLLRVNSGPRGNEYYGEAKRHDALKRHFYDASDAPMLGHIVLKVTSYASSGAPNTLLSRVHPLGPPLCLYSGRPTRESIKRDGRLVPLSFLHSTPFSLSLLNSSDKFASISLGVEMMEPPAELVNNPMGVPVAPAPAPVEPEPEPEPTAGDILEPLGEKVVNDVAALEKLPIVSVNQQEDLLSSIGGDRTNPTVDVGSNDLSLRNDIYVDNKEIINSDPISQDSYLSDPIDSSGNSVVTDNEKTPNSPIENDESRAVFDDFVKMIAEDDFFAVLPTDLVDADQATAIVATEIEDGYDSSCFTGESSVGDELNKNQEETSQPVRLTGMAAYMLQFKK
ncbi:hypothetical protein RYA05_05425 [Pseudomonas syringae pv. actinidiae]|nr:hypothetical protein [Pseudomonas syringae pv. actinidiae]